MIDSMQNHEYAGDAIARNSDPQRVPIAVDPAETRYSIRLEASFRKSLNSPAKER